MEMKMLSGFWSILKESFHVFSRNGKAMAFFSLFLPTIYSVLYLTNIFSMRPLIRDLIIINPISFSPDAASSSSHSALWWLIVVLSIAPGWFFVLATVLASSLTYTCGKIFPLNELLLRTWRSSWIRPLITAFSTVLILWCYIFLTFLLLMIPLVLFFTDNLKVLFYAANVVIAIVAVLIGTYINVILRMANIVSILEETSGFGAVKRGREVVKGMELQGLAIHFLLLVLGAGVVLGTWITYNTKNQSEVTRVVIGLIVLIYSGMVGYFGHVACTVFYYHCKRSRGEGIEFQGIEYSKVDTLPLTV